MSTCFLSLTSNEEYQARKIITSAGEYVLAMTIELKRRALPQEDASIKRNLELSAYFTVPKLEVAHRQLALIFAMKTSFGKNNNKSALSFANRILANGGSPKILENVRSLAQII